MLSFQFFQFMGWESSGSGYVDRKDRYPKYPPTANLVDCTQPNIQRSRCYEYMFYPSIECFAFIFSGRYFVWNRKYWAVDSLVPAHDRAMSSSTCL